MDRPDIHLVLAGHIDHGKSTLIGRLLYETGNLSDEATAALAAIDADAQAGGEDRRFAYVLDHLAEEREDNITIDTAQVFVRLGNRHYTLIDAPGHREFVRNMVTGASQADAAILLVAANEGVREQTRRHANLLAMLGVRQVLIVVNKMDKVLWSRMIFEHIASELTAHAAAVGLPSPTIIPLSAQRGVNLVRRALNDESFAWYTGPTLLEAIERLEPAGHHGQAAVMPVQDVYPGDGGDMLVGQIESGTFRRGDRVCVRPDGPAGTIERIETLQGDVESAGAPWSVAVRIAACPVEACRSAQFDDDKTHGKAPVLRRGQVITANDHPLPAVRTTRGRAFWMSPQPLRAGDTFQFRCATQEVACRVEKLISRVNSETLLPLEKDQAEFTDIVELELSFDSPAVLTSFDALPALGRFTLCRDKEVCAGGFVPSAVADSGS